ncbi:NAD(P)/FAD-dependent oxidoreductase [Flavobacterium arcticum]|uniref:NADH:ubiquinone reductase (non-electrogenic) n=1 Tax=Flavobacterium arcticum TaxID=1784713 RepID=A0A345HDP5_9FLAO|nr:NAD(P)/FAD-dependent oxidoreductase [Flavobacterium arcticum]AXG74705.1 NAD(P)/FAD-dependent oxidoreductase [Flavobacterium arcticum]KAF2509796.1 NAD(P)/FAD-dependent oxidoreductase [Flavobacterium arcticum]
MKVVIIGGGFAGINLAENLAENKNFTITLVDKNNYNFFPPLIYQVATAYLEPSSISYPFRKLFRGKKNIQFRFGELLSVKPETNTVVLHNGELEYDKLVFATGAETNYFGMENVMKNAIPMKTLNDAIEMRNRLLQRMEKAAICKNSRERRKYLNIVVAGGGPTGVEVSGMFAEMRNGVLRKEYPELATSASNIYLVDGGDALLGPMSKKSQEATYHALEKMGVVIKLNTRVTDFTDDTVYLSNGETISSKNLIWAAGVSAKTFEGVPLESYGRGRRMITDEFNKVANTHNIYAIGDTSIQTTDENFPNGHPQVAQVAIQQGIQLAKNFKRTLKNEALQPFKYNDKGSMAIIGKNKAVVDIPKPEIHFNGFIAWLAWLFIHLMSLISYRNRLATFWNWMTAYFAQDQSLRMIIRPDKRKNEDKKD